MTNPQNEDAVIQERALTPAEKKILEVLKSNGPCSVDDLIRECELCAAAVNTMLRSLIMDKRAEPFKGKLFKAVL